MTAHAQNSVVFSSTAALQPQGTAGMNSYTGLSQWRVETRIHYLPATWTGYIYAFAVGNFEIKLLFSSATDRYLYFQDWTGATSGCNVDIGSRTDITVRAQRDGSPTNETLRVWDSTGAELTNVSCSGTFRSGADDLRGSATNGYLTIGGTPTSGVDVLQGDMAYFRLFTTAASSTAAEPADPVATPADLLDYEFENNLMDSCSQGQPGHGQALTSLPSGGSFTYVSSGSSGSQTYSLQFQGAALQAQGTVGVGAYTGLTQWRVETRIHSLPATWSGYIYAFAVGNFEIKLLFSSATDRYLYFTDWTGSGSGCNVDIGSRTDITLRAQRDGSSETLRVWDSNGVELTVGCSGTRSGTDDLRGSAASGYLTIGGTTVSGVDVLQGDMAYFRLFTTPASPSAAEPADPVASPADLLDYEFENNLTDSCSQGQPGHGQALTSLPSGASFSYVSSTGGPPPGPPSVGTFTSGTGTTQTFTFTASSAGGFSYLNQVQVIFGYQTVDGANGCYVIYNQGSNSFSLMNDASTAAVPGSLPVSNSQCTLNSAQATGQGGTLTLQISLSFLPAFVGPLTVWEEAIDNSNQNSGWWPPLGKWTAYTASTTAPVVSVVTNPNGGTTGTFTFHVNDVNGYKYVNRYLMTIGAHDSAHSCEFLYYTSLNGIQILSDDETQWQLWSPLGTGGSAVGNSQCTVDALHASVTTQGTNDEYITLPVTFTTAYLANGTEPILATVIDRAQGWPWTQVANWATTAGGGTVTVTVGTSVAGLSFTVDGLGPFTSQQVYNWVPGDHHTLVTTSPQFSAAGTTQYTSSGWPDGHGLTDTYTVPASGGSYTANFNTQYELTININPTGAGTVTASPTGPWYAQGTSVTLSETPNGTHTFSGFSTPNPVIMNGPTTVAATFSPNTHPPLTITTTSLPQAALNAYYSASLAASGGVAPYAFLVQRLPSGLVQLPTGVISGLPNGQGTFPLSVIVTDSTLTQASATVSITISGSNPVLPVTAWPPSQSVSPNGSAAYNVAVNGTAGFSGSVNLTVSGLPPGATPVFNPPTVSTSGQTTLTVNATAGTQLGAFPVTVTAQSGSRSYNTSVMLTVASASAANMTSPAPGAILTTSAATFAWDSGMGATQYQLALGSTPGASDYFQMNTGAAQSATAQLPASGSVYATLGSLIGGAWQNQSYAYTIGQDPGPGPQNFVSRDTTQGQLNVPNDGKVHNEVLCIASSSGICNPLTSANYITSCSAGSGVTITKLRSPSGQYPSEAETFDVAIVALSSAATGPQTITCSYGTSSSLSWVNGLVVYDSTPVVSRVIPTTPVTPGGPYYAQIFGYNFGQFAGSVTVCDEGVGPCNPSSNFTSVCWSPSCGATFWHWDDNQVNALLTPVANPTSDYYALTVTSLGESGAGFYAINGLSSAQSQRTDGGVYFSCPPVISSVSVNGQATNTIVAGDSGSIVVTGQCLTSTSPILPTAVDIDGDGISTNATGPQADTQVTVSYQADSSATLGTRNLIVQTDHGPSNSLPVVVTPPSMKLEIVSFAIGPAYNSYPESTTIRVTAVNPTTGRTVTGFRGAASLAEDSVIKIYTQNGGFLAPSVTISSGGTSTTTANSLAGANPDRTRPNPALIKVTNYPIYGGADLSVPQWVVTGTPIDAHAIDSVPDWVQTKSRDVFASATGDAASVLSTVAYYTIQDLGASVEGKVDGTHASQSNIVLNPFNLEMRLDSTFAGNCGYLGTQIFRNTLLHEGRHAYQNYLASLPGNDNDGDFLVNNVPIAPTGFVIDSTSPRNVCNPDTGSTVSLSYHGDTVADTFDAPDFARYAIEKDAYDFASNH